MQRSWTSTTYLGILGGSANGGVSHGRRNKRPDRLASGRSSCAARAPGGTRTPNLLIRRPNEGRPTDAATCRTYHLAGNSWFSAEVATWANTPEYRMNAYIAHTSASSALGWSWPAHQPSVRSGWQEAGSATTEARARHSH